MRVLNKLTLKHLKLNKKRTIVTIIGIILSTALMVGIGLLFSSMQDYSIKQIISYSGSYQVEFHNITKNDYNKIKNEDNIIYYYEQLVGYSKLNIDNIDKEYLVINNVNDTYFKELKLIEGRFPKNSNEIVITNSLLEQTNLDYKVSDTINLSLGNRISNNKILLNSSYVDNETFVKTKNKEYKIVGIIEKSNYENYQDVAFEAYTTNDDNDNNLDLYIEFKDHKNIINSANDIANIIDYKKEDIRYNDSLLMMYGESRYSNIQNSVVGAMIIMLALISVGCIMVIYNSFAISVMERKKEFGLFSSIGATKKQILFSMLFEALVVGVIGIILGLLSSLLGIKIVLEITNYLIEEALQTRLELVIIPLYIIIPIIFMILTVLISSIIPAFKASRVSPIEAIRQNDDIKIKAKKLKTNKLVQKIFKVEGEIALKNIKRNKKKYRITMISLFISIVLFISFSTYLGYAINTSEDLLQTKDYDILFSIYDDKLKEDSQVKEFLNSSDIEKKVTYKVSNITITNNINNYNDKYLELQQKRLNEMYEEVMNKKTTDITIISLDENSYYEYLNELGLDEDKIIVLNKYSTITYENNNRKIETTDIYKDNFKINACKISEYQSDITDEMVNKYCNNNINNIYVTNKSYYGLDLFDNLEGIKLVVSENMFKYLYNNYHIKYSEEDNLDNIGTSYIIKATDYNNLDKIGEDLTKTNRNSISYTNITKSMQLEKNIVLVVKILMYGFIGLIVLIGITSVFNTITTSMALRRREFAVLRSIGLTNKGFNRILYFETLFIGLKAIIYGIAVSLIIIYLIHNSLSQVSSRSIYIPFTSFIIAIIAVFLIVFLTMIYSSRKIKKDNILEQIRQENI